MKTIVAFSIVVLTAGPIQAEPSQASRDLFEALRLTDVVAVMREEGIQYGEDLREELFPQSGSDAWNDAVKGIYDSDRMESQLLAGFDKRIESDDLQALTEFFTGEPGQTIVDLEIEARRAMQDADVEEAAEERAAEMRASETAWIGRIDAFIASNDLVEMNIVGSLNSNFAFYEGMTQGGLLADAMSEDQMIADIWAQEPQIRADTEDWIYGFLTLAYQPLNDDQFDAYVDLSASDAGQALNSALFAEFNAMFAEISRQLGVQAANFMQSQDI
ncbi:DUF2059 domain-containing protein [Palleronia sp. LCG004]|uniref:DUF2059 domain-containing protein n=1 Tax=Palleronia sp. LCG004 TaxID=3079304 RepID=UPI002943DD2F|nr:DUF2059 domain-containing protein [Palleronia sp. LCG004]WOI56983.1 DUF2059 domain-containing protein [Palleronia sp. LCG004]